MSTKQPFCTKTYRDVVDTFEGRMKGAISIEIRSKF